MDTARPRHSAQSLACPVSRRQETLLEALHRPGVSETFKRQWTIANALRVEPGIDVARAARAFDAVAKRHDCLRMHFGRTRDSWQAIIEPQRIAGVRVEDLGPQSDAELERIVNAAARAPFDLEAGPLVEETIYRCGDAGDVVFTRFHHLITDGWSMSIVLDELVKSTLGMPLWGPRPISFKDYLERFDVLPPGKRASADAYWKGLLLPALPRPAIGRESKGHTPNYDLVQAGPTEELSLSLQPEALAALDGRARRSQVTRVALMMAAYARTLARRGRVDGLYIGTNVAHRPRELSNFVGFDTSLMALRCDVAPAETVEALAAKLHRQIQTSLDHLPHESAIPRGKFDELVKSKGGHLRQFGGGMNTPERALLNSTFGSLLLSGDKRIARVGALNIEMLPIHPVGTTTHEMYLNLSADDKKGRIFLCFDTLAFDRDEARDILNDCLDGLGFDPALRGKVETFVPGAVA